MRTIAHVKNENVFRVCSTGRSYIAASDPSTASANAHLGILCYRVRSAGVAEDGTYECGMNAATVIEFPEDAPVEIVEQNAKINAHENHHTSLTGAEHEAANARCRQIDELKRVTLIRKEIEKQSKSSEEAFRWRIREALSEGVTVAEVRAETGLSRERVYQIRDNRR